MAKIKPKLKKKPNNSQWEIVDDLPKAQNGYQWSSQKTPSYQPIFQGNYNISKTTGNRELTSKEKEALRINSEKRVQQQKEAEYAARQARIQQSIAAQNQPSSVDNLKTESQSTGDKLSLAMNTRFGNPKEYPILSQYIEGLDYVNPFKMVGDMASGLGSVPYNLREGNYGQAALAIGTPLATGALAGIGAQGTKQFINNLTNPLAGIENPFKAKKFKSEINWSKWNPETPNYPELINEYNAIEESTKKAGTWMKNPDGSAFQGTPEQFIQQQSSHFKKAFGNTKIKDREGNPLILHHSSYQDFSEFLPPSVTGKSNTGYKGDYSFFHFSPDVAEGYGRSGNVKSVYINSENPLIHKDVASPEDYISKDYNLKNYDAISYRKLGKEYDFDKSLEKFDKSNKTYKNSLNDDDDIFMSEIAVPHGNYVKSAVGNVGFFDMTNPNIYKSIAPIGLGLGAASQMQQKKQGGKVKTTPYGQWEYPGEVTRIPSNQITMQGVDYPVYGVDNLGYSQMMYPGMNYSYPGSSVTEYPMMQTGGRAPLPISDYNEYLRRRQAYNDSLDLYNSYVNVRSEMAKQGYYPGPASLVGMSGSKIRTERDNYPYKNFFHEMEGTDDVKLNANGTYEVRDFKNEMVNKSLPMQLFNPNIKPIGVRSYADDDTYTYFNTPSYMELNGISAHTTPIKNDIRDVFVYSNVKPVQPVIYQPLSQLAQNPNPSTVTPSTTRTYKSLQRPKEQPIQSLPFKYQDDLDNNVNLQKYPESNDKLPISKPDWFSRPLQQGEKFQKYDSSGKEVPQMQYFDKKTGKLLGTYQDGGEMDEWEIIDNELPEAGNGYIVKRSSARKGKTHVVIGPDGTKKYFGDSKLGQHPKDPARKKAFYARHAKNLKNNPYFRAFARKTWAEGGMLPDLMEMAFGGNVILEKYQEGGVNPIEGNLYSKILMNRNKDKDFVNRAYAVGKYPESKMFQTWDDYDTRASHKMGWGEDESGQAYMFPTIMNPANEYIKVPNQYADYISSVGYKNETGIPTYADGGNVWEIVEDNKFDKGGKVVSEIWREVTGTPWSEAKRLGLTKGKETENIKLLKDLKQNPEKYSNLGKKSNIVSMTPEPLRSISSAPMSIETSPNPNINEEKVYVNVPPNTFNQEDVYYTKIINKDPNEISYNFSGSNPNLLDPVTSPKETWTKKDLNLNIDGTVDKLKMLSSLGAPNIYKETGKTCTDSNGNIVPECSAGVQFALDYNTNVKGDVRKGLGIKGDAWTIGNNIESLGGQRVYSLVENDVNRSQFKSSQDVKNYLDERKKTVKIDEGEIENGDFVEMWYKNSPNQEKALKHGKGTITTHIGIVTTGKDGKKYVTHNIHGRWESNPLNKVLNGTNVKHGSAVMASGIVRPDYLDNNSSLETIGIQINPKARFYSAEDESSYRKPKEAEWKSSSPLGRDSTLFTRGLAYYAPKIQQDFGLNDKETEQLMKLSFGIFGKESGFGKGKRYIEKESKRKLLDLYKDYAPDWLPEGDELSRGKGQIKIDTFFDTPEKKKLLERYGINKENIWDTENTAAALMLTSAINYKNFKDFSGASFKNMDNLTLQNILALAHNKGIDNVIKNEFSTSDKRTVGEKIKHLFKGDKSWNEKWDVTPNTNLEKKLEGFNLYSKLHLNPESYANLVADYAASLNVDYNKIKNISKNQESFVPRLDVIPPTFVDQYVNQINAGINKASGNIEDIQNAAERKLKRTGKILKRGTNKITRRADNYFEKGGKFSNWEILNNNSNWEIIN